MPENNLCYAFCYTGEYPRYTPVVVLRAISLSVPLMLAAGHALSLCNRPVMSLTSELEVHYLFCVLSFIIALVLIPASSLFLTEPRQLSTARTCYPSAAFGHSHVGYLVKKEMDSIAGFSTQE